MTLSSSVGFIVTATDGARVTWLYCAAVVVALLLLPESVPGVVGDVDGTLAVISGARVVTELCLRVFVVGVLALVGGTGKVQVSFRVLLRPGRMKVSLE